MYLKVYFNDNIIETFKADEFEEDGIYTFLYKNMNFGYKEVVERLITSSIKSIEVVIK